MKSIKSKIILIFISIFLFSSVFSVYFHIKHEKEEKFEIVENQLTVLTKIINKDLNTISKDNRDISHLIIKYLNSCENKKFNELNKRTNIIIDIQNSLTSLKIYNKKDTIYNYLNEINEKEFYHKIILVEDLTTTELDFKININLQNPTQYIEFNLIKIVEDSTYIKTQNTFNRYLTKSPEVENLLNGYSNNRKFNNYKIEDLKSYIYDSSLDLIFIIKVDKEVIVSNINKELIKDIIVNYIGIFVIVTGIIYFTLKYIIKDILIVNKAIIEIISGNLSHRIEHNRNDELGELMDKFNVMSKNLEEEVINNEKLEKLNENLQEEYSKYRALLDSSFEGIFLSDKGNCIDCNKAACKMFGYKYDEMIKIFGTDVIIDSDKDTVKKNMLSEYEIPYKVMGKRKDGTSFPILIRGKMFEYRGKQLRATSVIDISSATKLEEANKVLNEEINKFKALIDVSDDAILLFSLNNQKVVQHNESLFRLFGWDKKDMKYNNPMKNLDDWVHPDSIEKLQQNFLKEIPYTVKLLKEDGTTFDCRIKAKNIVLGGEKYRISVLRDITDKTTIQNYAHKLEKSNKELEQFAYIASHDLQEPIRTITSFLELFEERYSDIVDEDGKEFISYIMVAAHKQRKLINDLLRYSRLDTKREIREQDLNQILELTMMNLNRLVDEKHAVISSKTLPKMNCDFTQISQVFENLIKNAIKFNNNNPHITIDFEDRVDDVLFIFEDNGVGIDEKYHEKIFQAFQRLSNDDSGTGIGLAIVNKVIANHDGKIWLKSSEGNGSKFYFTISKKLKTT